MIAITGWPWRNSATAPSHAVLSECAPYHSIRKIG